MFPFPLGRLLVGSVLIGLFGAVISIVGIEGAPAQMRIDPKSAVTTEGGTFTVALVVDSSVPVNAYSGVLTFDPAMITVTNIDYNTSIANLWVEKPWYENGDGTLTFAGGTTEAGGFTGTGALLTVTFTTHLVGTAVIKLNNARILAHNGFGTDVPLFDSVDALFTVEAISTQASTIAEVDSESAVQVLKTMPDTDLNNDSKVNLADVSIFMRSLFSNNPEHDFNGDGVTNLADLSILLDARE